MAIRFLVVIKKCNVLTPCGRHAAVTRVRNAGPSLQHVPNRHRPVGVRAIHDWSGGFARIVIDNNNLDRCSNHLLVQHAFDCTRKERRPTIRWNNDAYVDHGVEPPALKAPESGSWASALTSRPRPTGVGQLALRSQYSHGRGHQQHPERPAVVKRHFNRIDEDYAQKEGKSPVVTVIDPRAPCAPGPRAGIGDGRHED